MDGDPDDGAPLNPTPADASRSEKGFGSPGHLPDSSVSLATAGWAGNAAAYRLITLGDLTLLVLLFLVYWYMAGMGAVKTVKAAPAGNRAAESKTAGMAAAAPPLVRDAWQQLHRELVEFIAASGLANDVTIESDGEEIALTMAHTLPFAPGRATLEATAFPVLEKLAAMVIGQAQIALTIGGSDDDSQDSGDAIRPSEKLTSARYSAVARYFIERGVHPARVAVQGYGDRDARQGNLSRTDRGTHRGVEITLFRRTKADAAKSEEKS